MDKTQKDKMKKNIRINAALIAVAAAMEQPAALRFAPFIEQQQKAKAAPNLDGGQATCAPKDCTPKEGKTAKETKKGDGKEVSVEVLPPGPPKDWKFTPSDRPGDELVKEKCEFTDGHTGVIVKKGTTLEEIMPMLDYFVRLGEHVGFFIGDVMVYARDTFKNRIDWAMQVTGRASQTVKGYETVARSVPIDARSAKLTFWHHQAVCRLENKKDIKALISAAEPKENAKGVVTKAAMTVRELRDKVNKEHPKPKKEKKDGKATSGKAGRKAPKKKEVTYYKPTAEEQAAIDAFFDAIKAPLDIIEKPLTKGGKFIGDIYVKMEYADKKGLCTVLKPFADAYNRVSFKMGYAK